MRCILDNNVSDEIYVKGVTHRTFHELVYHAWIVPLVTCVTLHVGAYKTPDVLLNHKVAERCYVRARGFAVSCP